MNKNTNFSLISLSHCPSAKFIRIDDKQINFHHDEKDKRIAFLDPFFYSDDLKNIKNSKTKNNDALYTDL